MMGGHHAASGAAVWIAVTTQPVLGLGPVAEWLSFLPARIPLGFGLLEVSDAGVLAGALVCAGAALLPDADHRHASIAQSLPPVSNLMCAGIGRVAGGHRNGTHSLLGIALFTLIAHALGLWEVHSPRWGTVFPGAGLSAVLLIAFALKALKFIPDAMRKLPWVVSIPAGAFVALFAPEEQYWFVLAVLLGTATHVLGDLLTVGGCNLLWPLRLRAPSKLRRLPLLRQIWRPSGRLAVPVLGVAGSWREWLLCVPVSLYAFLGIMAPVLGIAAARSQPLYAAFLP
ncbi:MAG: metal-dependent hydrolase [Arthrobacter sp.]|uniref:metal-dependent hydrolase n=1 Tax=unclassified Arthrobacter TaxID=235627 RepID=UPI00264D1BB3|nr:metal-dependent hydrolase [Micrococcaceae bacterium]MDN5812926.1 metal-dependent hydrolase [Micrococcaceae bacterium]MDN5823852.1 metal-dependent hydrolase [Micrococcaceae bacterium]MDN5878122.1 metal-dependent hydrolase [Micrococcaceae bacterium]MDN5885875.1 metal-dependent hydrolase [Micrococcaceae bacterium]